MKKRNFQFCHRNVAWHRYFNLNWGKFPKDRKCASTRDLNVSWIKWSKLMSSVHSRAFIKRGPWAFGSLWIAIARGLCSWCCALRITSPFGICGGLKGITWCNSARPVSIALFKKRLFWRAGRNVSKVGKSISYKNLSSQCQAHLLHQWVESIFEICWFQPDLGHA